jgi:K+-transporting ATPase A subunit
MSASIRFWCLTAILMTIVILCVRPLGTYIANVMEGRSTIAARLGGRFEHWLRADR